MKRPKVVRRSIAVLLSGMIWSGAAWGQSSPGPVPTAPRNLDPPPGVLVPRGSDYDLSLLYTGDVIGYLDPCG